MGRAYLEVHRDEGTQVVELSGEQVTLGREPANAVAFPTDGSASRRHAVVARVEDGWCVRDVGSSNGTFVNGSRLEADHALRPGDEIAVGEQLIVFRDEEEAPHTVVRQGAQYLDLSEEWAGTATPTPAPQPAAPVQAAPPTPTPEPQPAPIAVARPRSGSAHVRGVARSIQIRQSEKRPDVLAFRVDQFDAYGNRLDPVGVELSGYRSGQIGEGDEVEVHGRWSHGTVRAKRIVNRSTSADVKSMGHAQTVVGVIAFGAVCLFIAYIAITGFFM